MSKAEARFRTLAWVTLGWTGAVILWGAFVRASLSGDGCGDHWPLCNGVIVPPEPTTKTIVELTHRVTSGLAWLLALALPIAARRAYPRGHRVRWAAGASLLLMTTEALVGAGLVLFRMVASNPSSARAFWMAAHLSNTFLLLAALALTAWWASGRPAPARGQGGLGVLLGVALGAVLLVAVSGAIAALGDTLFPVETLAEGIRQDLSPGAHALVRLRVWHPLLALGSVVPVLAAAGAAARRAGAWRGAVAVAAMVSAQIGLGFLNVALLAPIWLQLVHLFVADLLWVTLVLTASTALAAPGAVERRPAAIEERRNQVATSSAAR